jgi:hypothetical protein
LLHGDWLAQHVPLPQTGVFDGHAFGHVTICPQLLVAEPHSVPMHVVATGSGVQQV